MAEGSPPGIDHLLNGPRPAPDPEPGPAPVPPPSAAPAPPPPPAKWPAPAPPSSGASGTIVYTQSALDRFAQTSDERATAFGKAYGQAEHIQVSRDAFGYMFGALVYSAYEKHAQSVTSGLQSAGTAMTAIAGGMRETAARMHAANQDIERSIGQSGAGSAGG
jgi:hypothetical protein